MACLPVCLSACLLACLLQRISRLLGFGRQRQKGRGKVSRSTLPVCVVGPAPPTDPAREVRYLSDVAGNGVRGVPALGQVTLERDDVGPDGAGGEPIELNDARVLSGIHGDLRKWVPQCAPTPKLCPVQRMTTRRIPRRRCLRAISDASPAHSRDVCIGVQRCLWRALHNGRDLQFNLSADSRRLLMRRGPGAEAASFAAAHRVE